MKKILLFAACGMMAVSVSAQYQVNPSTAEVLKGGVSSVTYITLSDAAIAQFEAAGAKTLYVGPDPDNGRNLWYWDSTLNPSDDSTPRVDNEEGGYISVEVTDKGWSGAGVAIDNGVDLGNFTDDTHFHLAYFTPTNNAPASIAIILLDQEKNGSVPAKVAVGESFNDNGTVFPTIGAKATDEWQGIDITLGNLKKLWPNFKPINLNSWTGNIFSFLGGGVQGTTFAFDAVYFYNTKEGGVKGVATDAADFIVTGNTVNVLGGNGIALYNLAGQKVKATEGTTLGLNNLAKGIYVAKSGNKAVKVVVK